MGRLITALLIYSSAFCVSAYQQMAGLKFRLLVSWAHFSTSYQQWPNTISPPATEQKLYKLYGETYRQRRLVNPFLYVGLTRENKYHF